MLRGDGQSPEWWTQKQQARKASQRAGLDPALAKHVGGKTAFPGGGLARAEGSVMRQRASWERMRAAWPEPKASEEMDVGVKLDCEARKEAGEQGHPEVEGLCLERASPARCLPFLPHCVSGPL